MSPRLPRFQRVSTVTPIELTERDYEIIRQIYRHRFLRSNQVISLVGGSPQQVVRRLQLLFHHGYLERPRAQLQYYERSGPKHFAYGLGNKGGALLREKFAVTVNSHLWNEKNQAIGRLYLEHTLFVAEVMVSLELACRNHDNVKLIHTEKLGLPVEKRPFQWRVNGKVKHGVVPDCVFALEHADENGQTQRIHFFLEADRGTMPVVRQNPHQSSFNRKLIAYEATWTQKIHLRQLSIQRFRVLTVTTSAKRVNSMIDACSKLKRGHGLFLFADQMILEKNLLSAIWQCGKHEQTGRLLD